MKITKNKLKKIINEQIILNSFEDLVKYFESKININKYKKSIYQNGNEVSYKRQGAEFEENYVLMFYNNLFMIKFKCSIFDSISLSDQRAKYKTTSARKIINNKIFKLEKASKEIDSLKNFINKFFVKFNPKD